MARLPPRPPVAPASAAGLPAGEPGPAPTSASLIPDVQAAVAQIEQRMASAHASVSSQVPAVETPALPPAFASPPAAPEHAAPPPTPMVKLFEPAVQPPQSELGLVYAAATPFDAAEQDRTLPELTTSSMDDVVQRFEAAVSSFESTVTSDLPAPHLHILAKPIAPTVDQFETTPTPAVPPVETVEMPFVPIAPMVEQFETPVEAEVPVVEAAEMPFVPIAPTVERFETPLESGVLIAKPVDIPSSAIGLTVEQFEAPVKAEIPTSGLVEMPSVWIAPTVKQFETPIETKVPTAKPVDPSSVPIAPTVELFEAAIETETPASGQVEMPSVPIAQIVEQFETPVDAEVSVVEPVDVRSVPVAPTVGQFEATDATDVPAVESVETAIPNMPIVERFASPIQAEAPVEEAVDTPTGSIAPIIQQVETTSEADVLIVEHSDANVGPVAPMVEQFEALVDVEHAHAESVQINPNPGPIASVVEKFENSTEHITVVIQQLDTDDSQIAAAAENFEATATVETKAEIVDARVVAEGMEKAATAAEPAMRTDHGPVSGSKVSTIIQQLETTSAPVMSQNEPLDVVPAPSTSALEQEDSSADTALTTEQNKSSVGAQVATAVEQFEASKDIGEPTHESREDRLVGFAPATPTTDNLETVIKSEAEMMERNSVSLDNTAGMVQVGEQSAIAGATDEAHEVVSETEPTFGLFEIIGTLEAEASIDTEQTADENTESGVVSDDVHAVSSLPESVSRMQDNSPPRNTPTLEHLEDLEKPDADVWIEQNGNMESVPIIENIDTPLISLEATPGSLETTSTSAIAARVVSPEEPEIASETVAVCKTEAAAQEHHSEKVSQSVEAGAEAVEAQTTTNATAPASDIFKASAISEPTSGTPEVSSSLVAASMQPLDLVPDPAEMEKESAGASLSPVQAAVELSSIESAIPPSEPKRAVDNGIVSAEDLKSLDAADDEMVASGAPSGTTVVPAVPHIEHDEAAPLPKSGGLDAPESAALQPPQMSVAASEAAVVDVSHCEAPTLVTLTRTELFDVAEGTTQQPQDESRDPDIPLTPISFSSRFATTNMAVDLKKEITDKNGSASPVMFDRENPEYFVADDHDMPDKKTAHPHMRSTAEETVTVSFVHNEEEANMHSKSVVQGERIASEMPAAELARAALCVVPDHEPSSESPKMEPVNEAVVIIGATAALDKAALPCTPVKPSTFQSEILGSPVTPNVEVPIAPSSQTSEESDDIEGSTISTRTRLSRRLSQGARTFEASLHTSATNPQRPASSVIRTGNMLPDGVSEIKIRSKTLGAVDSSSPPVRPVPHAGRPPRKFTTGDMRKNFSRSPGAPSADRTSQRLPRVAELTGNEGREKMLSRLPLPRGATFSGTVPRTRASTSRSRTLADVSSSPATLGTYPNDSDNDSTTSAPVTAAAKSRSIRRTLSFTHNRRSTMAGALSAQMPFSWAVSPAHAPVGSNSGRQVAEASGSPKGKKLDRRATMSMSEPSRARPPRGGSFMPPPFSPPKLPRSKPTVPQPFRLSGLELHEKAVQQIEEARRKADEDRSRRRSFKAKPMPDFSNPYPKPNF